MKIDNVEIDSIQVIPVDLIKPGDVIVLHVNSKPMQMAEAEMLKHMVRKYFPSNEIIVLNNVEISIKRQS